MSNVVVITQWQFGYCEQLCEQVVVKVEKKNLQTLVTVFFAPYPQEITIGPGGEHQLLHPLRWQQACQQARVLGESLKRSYTQTLIIPWKEEEHFSFMESAPIPT